MKNSACKLRSCMTLRIFLKGQGWNLAPVIPVSAGEKEGVWRQESPGAHWLSNLMGSFRDSERTCSKRLVEIAT